MNNLRLIAACLALTPLPAMAQAAPPSDAAAGIDPARLAEAHKLLDQMIPPEKRLKMMEDIIRPMIANMRVSFDQSPQFQKLFAKKPGARDRMYAFLDQEIDRSLGVAKESMPALYDAMAIAYARQFGVAQLTDIQRFFASPTGRLYVDRTPAIMSDPAVQAAQRAMMQKSFDGLEARVRDMAQRLETDTGKGGAS